MSSLTCELRDDALVAAFRGPIDRKTSPHLNDAVLDAYQPAVHLICDLSETPHVSSSGYQLLLHLYYQASTRGGQTAIVGACEEIRRAMRDTGFSEFFLMADSLEEALEQTRATSLAPAGRR